jgi:hypothetical protein
VSAEEAKALATSERARCKAHRDWGAGNAGTVSAGCAPRPATPGRRTARRVAPRRL